MMHTLIKRLEIIKHCIALGDEDIIASQLVHLEAVEDDAIQSLLELLRHQRYAEALTLMDHYLSHSKGLVLAEDMEAPALKLELKALEAQLLQANEEKISAEQLIAEFRSQYHLALGEVLQAILDCTYKIHYQKNLQAIKKKETLHRARAEAKEKIEVLKEKIQELKQSDVDDDDVLDELHEAIDALKEAKAEHQAIKEEVEAFEAELNDDEDFQSYKEAEQDKQHFEEEIEQVIEKHQHELSDEDKARLKKAYRKAARLCHPDTVSEELKAQAHHVMSQLNVAYDKQDIVEVERILQLLVSGAGFVASSDSLDASVQLKAKIAELRHSLSVIEAELEKIHQDETYQQIQTIEDWDLYFDAVHAPLERRREELEQVLHKLLHGDEEDAMNQYYQKLSDEFNEIIKKDHRNKDDDYWVSEF